MPGLTAYEEEREERIAQNKQRMNSLLGQTLQTLHHMTAPSPKPRRPSPNKERRRSMSLPLEIRRSGRTAGLPVPNYALDLPRHTLIERAPRARRSWKAAPGGFDSRGGWHPGRGEAGGEAARRALDAADAAAEELPNPAFPKVMTVSQVAGGFWSNAAKGLAEAIPWSATKRTFELRLAPGTTLVDGSDADCEETWPVVWLPRNKDAGLSGGWRTFAIDMDLFPSDVCLFEVPAADADSLVVHIFRAMSFERGGAGRAAGDEEDEEEEEEEAVEEEEDGGGGEEADQGAEAAAAEGGSSGEEEEEEEEAGPSRPPAAHASAAQGRKRQRGAAAPSGGAAAKRRGAAASKRAASKEKKPAPRAKPPPQQQQQQAQPEEEEEEGGSDEEEAAFAVEKILASRLGADGQRQYLISWRDYGEEDNTWEPAGNLDAHPRTYPRAPGVEV